MEMSNDFYYLIYGDNANIAAIKDQKNFREIWDDAILFLAQGDITKIQIIREMSAYDVFRYLELKVEDKKATRSSERNPIGYKLNEKQIK